MNPARQASILAGIPQDTPAMTVSMVCGSGLRSVALARAAVLAGDASVIVAGGQESMSQSTHCLHMREGVKFGDKPISDTMLKDGLTDAFHSIHMGLTAEAVAEKWGITREEQDQFAADSQRKAGEAMTSGAFEEEILPIDIPGRKGQVR